MRASRPLRLGTRGSRLALLQAQLVADRLRELGVLVELVTVITEGDLHPEPEPGEGVFVAALERELAAGRIDLAVHSAKDVPLRTLPGLTVAAYPERADPRDALVTSSGGATVERLPADARVGTDSPRRAAFLRSRRPDLRPIPLRGNVDTRLRKLDEGKAEALLLAAAGLDRLGLGARIDQRLDPELFAPAPGQGALAVQCRSNDDSLLRLLGRLDDRALRLALAAERGVLEATGGSCRSPVGALAQVSGGRLRLLAAAAAPDGSQCHVVRLEGEPTAASAAVMAAAAGRELKEKVVSPVA